MLVPSFAEPPEKRMLTTLARNFAEPAEKCMLKMLGFNFAESAEKCPAYDIWVFVVIACVAWYQVKTW